MINNSTEAQCCEGASMGSDHSSAVPLQDQGLEDKFGSWSCVIVSSTFAFPDPSTD